MESLAPPVVAVIVTCDPGPWFEETLKSFADQDYPELSVLVLDACSDEDPTPRVAAVLPNAFVRRLEENNGFGASVDAVLGMVAGASHLLLCHDDIALDVDSVHALVEESFRSNAGVVAPKLVSWDDPSRLLHVGMSVDKGGAVIDRVEPGEIDHGQHDGVRDVFLAPGGCLLVRADLFAELGGFDPALVALGDDLDLCWRAQVAGARVVVAPAARVRHLERLAGGERVPPGDAPSLQALQRRHELRVVLVAYGRFHLARVLPQLLLLNAGEMAVAVLTGHRDRAAALWHAWRWNWVRRKEIRARRAEMRQVRRLPDSEVRRLQVRGSARLTAYVRRLFTHGLEAAHIGASASAPALDSAGSSVAGADQGVMGNGTAADGGASALIPGDAHRLEDAVDFESPARQDGPADVKHPFGSRRLVTWLVVTLVLLIGTRQLLGLGFPAMTGLLPFPGWTTLLHRFATGWHTPGLGGADPTSPATGPLGIVALILGGSSGLMQKVVVLGCVPVGAWGVTRLLRPFASTRGRVAAGVVYLALPVAYDALALGRWDALVAYAAAPWIIARLARASGLEPFASASAGPARRRGALRQVLALSVLEAALCSLAPAGAALTLLMGLGLSLGAFAALGAVAWRPAFRMTGTAVGGTAVATVLLAPWSVTLLAGPQRWGAITGLSLSPGSGPNWSSLLRLAVGPIGDSPLAYGLVIAALLPLVIAARHRLTWAAMVWGLVLSAWVVAWTEGRGFTASLAIPIQMLLVPAAVGVAVAVGLGVAAFERDLPAYRFGWRQVAAALAAATATLGVLPVLAAVGGGRWDVPTTGYAEATDWFAARAPAGGFRVLWLADPRSLPGGGWQLDHGVGYALSIGGLPDETSLWAGSSPGPASKVRADVELAEHHDTVQLGHLLAAERIRYVVVVSALAPAIPGYQLPATYPVPAVLSNALAAQSDLSQVPGQGGLDVYVDVAAPPHGRPPAHGDSPWPYRVGIAAEVVVWLGVLAGLAGRLRRRDRAARRARSRRRRHAVNQPTSVRGGDGGAGLPRGSETPAGVGR